MNINPYLLLPCLLAGNEGEEPKEVTARIQPDQIQGYADGYHFGSLIYMLGGVIWMTKLTAKELDFVINNYWAQLAKRDNKSAITLLQ